MTRLTSPRARAAFATAILGGLTMLGQTAEPRCRWDLTDAAHGWEALNACTFEHDANGILRVTYDGEDPYFASPECAVRGPVRLTLRVRSSQGGHAVIYYRDAGDGGFSGPKHTMLALGAADRWVTVSAQLDVTDLRQIRIDPPGSEGVLEVDWIEAAYLWADLATAPWQIAVDRTTETSKPSRLGVDPVGVPLRGWHVPPPEGTPRVTVRWEDPDQKEVFIVEGQRYRCRVHTWPFRILSLDVDGRELLGMNGAALRLTDDAGRVYTPAPREAVPNWDVWIGQGYKTARSSRARFNLWSPGIYYWDAHVLDIPMVREGSDRPLRTEVVFHAYADRLNVQVCVDPEDGGPSPRETLWLADAPEGEVTATAGRTALQWWNAAMLGRASSWVDDVAWHDTLSGQRPSTHLVFRPNAGRERLEDLFVDELRPLAPGDVEIDDGQWLGHQPASGLYLLASAPNTGLSFNNAYANPGRRVQTGVRLRNGPEQRDIILKTISDIGILESTILTDTQGHMLPVPVQSSKNFAGEREEPDDSAYGDAYVALSLAPGETRDFNVCHLFQNWGTHMLKQISSIRFFNVYWHLSTGVSESTCYTLGYMKIGHPQPVRIPDYRPYSGEFWPGQPQHDCLQFPGFLQCNGGQVALLHDRTLFHSMGPCAARYTMEFHTTDGAATARIEAMETPMDDEMRIFLRIRYDWQRAMRIDGDARLNFRWLNVRTRASLPERLFCLDAEEELQVRDLDTSGEPMFLGVALADLGPFIGSHGQPNRRYDPVHSLAMVRRFEARLQGEETDRVIASAASDRRVAAYWLTTGRESLTLQPGDYIDADVVLIPYAGHRELAHVPEMERLRWVLQQPVVTDPQVGTKISDFPARVKADGDVAAFTVKGGHNWLPVIVEGLSDWRTPMVWLNGQFYNQDLQNGRGIQVDRDTDGTFRATLTAKMRRDETLNLFVARLACTKPITAITDNGGYVRIRAQDEASFEITSPAVFSNGTNRVVSGGPGIRFSGEAREIRQLPLSVSVDDGEGTLVVQSHSPEETLLQVTSSHGARAGLRNPSRVCAYSIAIGEETVEKAPGAPVTVDLPAGTHRVSVRVNEIVLD